MLRKYALKAYRKVFLAVLGLTRVLYRFDIDIPGRWKGLFDTLQVSSGSVYCALASLDDEVDREVQEWETRFERSFGKKKFYSDDELSRISEEFSDISVK